MIDFQFIIDRSIKARKRLSKGIHYLVRKNNVDFYPGFGRFIDNKSIEIDGAQISAQNFIIATGSKPKMLENINTDSEKIIYASQDNRLEMLKIGLTNKAYIVDDRELCRGGTSYAIDTIKSKSKQ